MDLRKAADDEIGEIFSNGEPINWSYWASLKKIEPRQAAILAHSIDPIKWEDGTFENGQWPDSLKTKIQYLHVWLSDRADSYTLPSLVAALGEGSTPCGMKEGAQLHAPQQVETVKPVQRTAAQDAAILNAITQAGYDPLALPKNEAGKSGAKAEIRKALDGNPLFVGATVFDKAWDRLRSNEDIRDKK